MAFQRSRKSRRSIEITVPEGSFLAFQRSPKTRRATEITIPEGSFLAFSTTQQHQHQTDHPGPVRSRGSPVRLGASPPCGAA